MNEIEKLYKLAGVETNPYCCDTSCGEPTERCKDCADYREVYTPFMAEKQIAILQLLTQRCDLTISHFTEWEFVHFDGQDPTQVTGKDFTETFAKLINSLWQDLTEEDQDEIRKILEGNDN